MPGTENNRGGNLKTGGIAPPAGVYVDADYLSFFLIVLRNTANEIQYWLRQGNVPGAMDAVNGLESTLDQAGVRLASSGASRPDSTPPPQAHPLLRLQLLPTESGRRNEFLPGQVWCKADGSPDFTVQAVHDTAVEIDWCLDGATPERHRFEKLDLLTYVTNQNVRPVLEPSLAARKNRPMDPGKAQPERAS